MLGTRYEEYEMLKTGLPFVLNADIKRNSYNLSKETNWHENLEIQFCMDGAGTVLLDGKKHSIHKDDIVLINSNVIHYTGTDSELTYDCLIVGTDFCKQMDLDISFSDFKSIIKSQRIADMFLQFKKIYSDLSYPYRKANLNKILLQILLELTEYCDINKAAAKEKSKGYERVKLTIIYIRENYNSKITLEQIARFVLCDKYTLCKEFKKFTGQTVFENLNNYRCLKAAQYLSEGITVTQAASLCGFENFSFFSKTFKKHIGTLPSKYKNARV